MPPKRVLRKTQLTLDAFKQDAVNSNLRSKNARRAVCSPPAPLPKPTAPAVFRPSSTAPKSASLPLPTTTRPVAPNSSQHDAAWNLARTIYDAGIVHPTESSPRRQPYGDENSSPLQPSPQTQLKSRHVESNMHDGDNNCGNSDDDDDFQSNPQQPAPSSKIRRCQSPNSSPPLRDDRPSMTRRSAKKSKRRIQILQTPTLSLSEEADSEHDAVLTPRRRLDTSADHSQAPLRVTALFAGNHSELSSDTDHDDRPVRLSSLRLDERANQHPTRLLSPNNPARLDSPARSPRLPVTCTSSDVATPIANLRPSSAMQNGLHVGAHAPRKEAIRSAPIQKVSLSSDRQRLCSRADTTRKRGRDLVSLFNDDSLGSADGRADHQDDDFPNIAYPVSAAKDRPGSSKRVTPDPPQRHRLASTNRPPSSPDSSDVENNNIVVSPSPQRPSARKRRRVVASSSSDDGCNASPRTPNLPLSSECFRTPDNKRLLPESMRHEARADNFVVDSDVEIIGNTLQNSEQVEPALGGKKHGHSDKSPSKRVTRRSGRLRSRAKSELLNMTQSESPSPPSTRKRGRFSKLQTRASSEDEDELGGAKMIPSARKVDNGADFNAKKNTQIDDTKSKEWFFERDIGQFSSSSSDVPDFKRTPVGGGKGTIIENVGNVDPQPKPNVKPTTVERCIIAEFSDDENEIEEVADVESVGNTPTQSPSPKISTAKIEMPNVGPSGAIRVEDDVDVDVMDLIDVDDSDDFEEPLSHPSRAAQVVGLSGDVMEVDDNDQAREKDVGPPPFNLHALCESGEDVLAMVERLGEGHVLELVSKAQKEGRRIVGGEELGLDRAFDTQVFDKYSKTVVATEIGKDRSGTLDITEKALRGEYQFNYRGRSANASAGSSGRGAKRGRGRGRGRGFPYWRRRSGGRRRGR